MRTWHEERKLGRDSRSSNDFFFVLKAEHGCECTVCVCNQVMCACVSLLWLYSLTRVLPVPTLPVSIATKGCVAEKIQCVLGRNCFLMLECLLQMRIRLYVLHQVKNLLVWLSSDRWTLVLSMCDPHRDRWTVNTCRAGNPEPLVFRFSRACSRFVNLQILNYATEQRKRTEDALCFDCFICQSCHDIHSHRWPTLQWMHRVNHCHEFIIWYNIDAKVGRPFAAGENDSC